MNFDLTDEQQMLQGAARDFLASRLNSEKIRALGGVGATPSATDLWKEMAELGWPGLVVSEEHGGQGLGTVELAVLFEQLGYALAPGPVLSNTLAALALSGGDRRAARALAGAAGGRREARHARALGPRRGLDAGRHHARAAKLERRLHAQRREALRARRRDAPTS